MLWQIHFLSATHNSYWQYIQGRGKRQKTFKLNTGIDKSEEAERRTPTRTRPSHRINHYTWKTTRLNTDENCLLNTTDAAEERAR